MKVSTIVVIILFLVTLIGSIGGNSYYYVRCNNVMAQEVYEHLEGITQARAEHIKTFLDLQKDKFNIISSEAVFVDMVSIDKNDVNYENVLNSAKERILELNLGIGIFDTNGKILVAQTNPVGTDYSDLDFFKYKLLMYCFSLPTIVVPPREIIHAFGNKCFNATASVSPSQIYIIFSVPFNK